MSNAIGSSHCRAHCRATQLPYLDNRRLRSLVYVLNALTSPTQVGGGPVIETRLADGSLALTQIPVDVPVFPGMYWNGTSFSDTLPGTTLCHPYTIVENKKIYTIYPEWEATTVYVAGAKINISGFWYSTVAGGTSGTSAPVGFATGAPSVTDNTVTWTYSGLYASGHGGVLGEPAGTNYVNWPVNPSSWGIINGCVITNLGNKNGLFNRASIAPNPTTPSVFDRSEVISSLALVANDIVTCRIFMEAGTSGKYNSIIKNIASSALTTIDGTFNSSPVVSSVLAGTVTELSEVTSGGYTTLSFRFKASATSNFHISLGPNSAVIGETVIALGSDIKKQLAFDSLVLTGAGSAVTRTASDITVPTSFSGSKPGALVSRLGYQKTMVPGGSLLKLPNTYAILSFMVGKTTAYIDEVLAGRTEFALMARTLNTSIFTQIDSPSGPYQLTFVGANGAVYQTTANNTTVNVEAQGLTAPVWVLVPKEVANDVGVTTISYANNKLAGLAPPLDNYPSLTSVSYASNQLTGSAPSLGICPNLSLVSYGYNKLTGLVPSLGNCPSLAYASYASNGLTGVVSGFGVPNKAFTLQLGYNLFPAEVVNQIIAVFRAVLTVGGGTLNINGTGNAAPTGQGLIDKQWMIDLGWSVGTN